MRILSIDHSFKRTGVAVMEDYKIITTGAEYFGEMSYENIEKFYSFVTYLIKTYKPDIVVTEKPAHMRNIQILRMLTSLHTIAIIASIKASVPYSIVNPKIVKKAITGKGNALKEEVMDKLIQNYGYKEEDLCKKNYYKKDNTKIKNIDYDESDAVSNAVAYLIERGIKNEA